MSEDRTINECADFISSLSFCESSEHIISMANLLALIISKGKSSDQLNLIGSFLSCVAGIVSLNATQKSIIEEREETVSQINDLKKQIKGLEEELSKLPC